VIFLQNGKIKLQMEAVKQEMKDMEVRLREDYDRKLSVIRQDMLKDAQKISSDIVLESEEVNETSKVDETVTEDVINVSNEVDDTNKKLVDNLQNEIAEEQAEEAQIE
jgi:cell division septum initiation protein DivIVA